MILEIALTITGSATLILIGWRKNSEPNRFNPKAERLADIDLYISQHTTAYERCTSGEGRKYPSSAKNAKYAKASIDHYTKEKQDLIDEHESDLGDSPLANSRQWLKYVPLLNLLFLK